jgi:hypothetical protein
MKQRDLLEKWIERFVESLQVATAAKRIEAVTPSISDPKQRTISRRSPGFDPCSIMRAMASRKSSFNVLYNSAEALRSSLNFLKSASRRARKRRIDGARLRLCH